MGGMARRAGSSHRPRDLTVLAVPFYFASMGLEYLWLRRRTKVQGPTAGNYERRDTLASLTMGVGSLLAPLVTQRLLRPLTPGRGRFGKVLVRGAVGAVVVTTAADFVTRRLDDASQASRDAGRRAFAGGTSIQTPASVTRSRLPEEPTFPAAPNSEATVESANGSTVGAEPSSRQRIVRAARRVASIAGVAAVALGGVAVTTTWASRTTPERLWRRRVLPDIGTGPLALAAAIAAWDFVYYWDHRFMHSSRYMWAIHVVHHSSEHYNLSTALRQPVAEALGTFVPFGGLCLFGIRPQLVETARGVNLLYQYWIHTESIGLLGPPEAVLNTPSHHRVHHGSNRQYLDRNHGSILIIWDRLFGTFEPERERVVYGLTKNINTFNPIRIACHEYIEMLRDVADSTSWRERLSHVVRGPGWASKHRSELNAHVGSVTHHEADATQVRVATSA